LVNYIDPEDFKTIFLPLLSALSNDDVVNVRLSVAATLKKITSVGKNFILEYNQKKKKILILIFFFHYFFSV